MQVKVLVPIAQGTEELEAITIIDLLRRAGVLVKVAGENEIVTCSRGVKIIPDTLLESIDTDLEFDAVVLPGGLQGTNNLMKYHRMEKILRHQIDNGRIIAAICAAPTILTHFKIIDKGTKLTSHPSVREQFKKYDWKDERVVEDGLIITGKGAGTAIEFTLTLINRLCGDEISDKIAEEIVYR